MARTPSRSPYRALLGATALATVACGALAVTPAGAQQHGGDAQVAEQCRRAGGSWRPTVVGGVEGHACRINISYGCGIDLAYDTNGKPMGGDAWCLGGNISWGRL